MLDAWANSSRSCCECHCSFLHNHDNDAAINQQRLKVGWQFSCPWYPLFHRLSHNPASSTFTIQYLLVCKNTWPLGCLLVIFLNTRQQHIYPRQMLGQHFKWFSKAVICSFFHRLFISSSLLACRFPACAPRDRNQNPPEPNVSQITFLYLLAFCHLCLQHCMTLTVHTDRDMRVCMIYSPTGLGRKRCHRN